MRRRPAESERNCLREFVIELDCIRFLSISAQYQGWWAPAIRYNLPDMITFLLALLALIIAVMNGTGKGGRIPLWVAVALLALGMMIPWLVSISVL